MVETTNKRVIVRRILGGILVLSAAALVLPRLLDGSGVVPANQRVAIPPPPPVTPAPNNVEYLDRQAAQAMLAAPEPSTGPEPSSVPSNVSGGGWVVQLGTFAKANNAQRLVAQLREGDETAFVRDLVLADGSEFYQVMVGPIRQESQARALKAQLDERFQLSGLVLEFQP